MSELKLVKAIIIGDGHIDKKGSIRLHHSKKQEEWLDKKINILNNADIKTRKKCYTKSHSYGEIRDFVKVETRRPTKTKSLRELFYPNGIKVIPKEFLNYFDFEMLSIIYQDDGRQNKINHTNNIVNNKKTRVETIPFVNYYEFCLESFDKDSLEVFVKCLEKIGIESRISKRNRVIISRAKSKIIFYENIKPFVINSMEYKLSAIPTLSYEQ